MAKVLDTSELSDKAMVVWKHLNADFALEYHQKLLLLTALGHFDLCLSALSKIKSEGVTYKTQSGYIKKNPALDVLKENRSIFLNCWKLIGFHLEPPKEVGGQSKY